MKTKLGVGSKSIGGFATAFGFPSVEALRRAAYEWALAQGAPGGGRLAEPAVAAAIETVLGIRPDVTRVQVETVLTAFAHERFAGRETDFWVQQLLTELQVDRAVENLRKQRRYDAEQESKKQVKAVQAGFRTGHRRRKAEAEAAGQAAQAAAETPPEARPTRRRLRKRAG